MGDHVSYKDQEVLHYLESLGMGEVVKSVHVNKLGEAYMVTLQCTETLPSEVKDRLYEAVRFRLTHRNVLVLNGKIRKLAVRYTLIKGGAA